ncbi:MAG: hypothetical protein JWQ72_2934 [Polaromonas sp.]|nr:hypothetical protein [Polaromonas sp.]
MSAHDASLSGRFGEGLRRVVWPGFLAACVLEGLVFAVVDPGEVHWPGGFHGTRQSIYTLAFFLFWLVNMACSSLVLWMAPHGEPVNGSAAD